MERLAIDQLQIPLHFGFLPRRARPVHNPSAVVCRVTENRMVFVSQVDTDLVCSSRPQAKFEEREIVESFQYCIVSHRVFPACYNRHALPV
jgi:hypothetical protein